MFARGSINIGSTNSSSPFKSDHSKVTKHPNCDFKLEDGGSATIINADALEIYQNLPKPATIISDGAYGLGGFPGDPRTVDDLPEWYLPHIAEWSKSASLATTLWFWNSEIGWAKIHPILESAGWKYEFTVIWDKGLGHIAGNVNGKTLRRFPVASEICVFYSRQPILDTPRGMIHAKSWIRDEWKRSGLPMRKANEACGVKDAATRKYFTQDWLWYSPPGSMMARLAEFANTHGDPNGMPYYMVNGKVINEQTWDSFKYKWNYQHGLTNVWQHGPLHGSERVKGTGRRSAPRVYKPTKSSAAHLNQKPLEFMKQIVTASTDPGDVIWEPFGGLCTGSIAALGLARVAYATEVNEDFYELAKTRCKLAIDSDRQASQSEMF